MIVIHDLKEIPAFASEAEEQEYWDTHRLSVKLLRQMVHGPLYMGPLVETEHTDEEWEAAGFE